MSDKQGRVYWRVSPLFWTDEKVTGTDGTPPWSDDTKLLALYLLTGPHRNLEGLFRLPLAYIAADLGWDMERLREPFRVLLDERFIEYDNKACMVLIVNALDYQSPDNDNHAIAGVKKLAELPPSPLFARLLQLADLYSVPLARQLRERLPERFRQPCGEPPAPAPAPAPSPAPEPTSADAEVVDASPPPDDIDWDGTASSEPQTTLPIERISYKRIIEMWKATCPSLPAIIEIKGDRQQRTKRLFELVGGYQGLEEFFKRVEASDFLAGRSPSKTHPHWRANYDFVTQRKTVIKILEGTHDNRRPTGMSKTTADMVALARKWEEAENEGK